MDGIELGRALREGRRVYGTLIASPSPFWVPKVASLGLDFVFIDTEHIPLDRSQAAWMCQAYAAAGLAPIVRIPMPDPYHACMALDGGAVGLVAPYIETVDQVKALRGAVKLRPIKGAQLDSLLAGQTELAEDVAAYEETWNRGRLLILNIESVAGIEALPELLAVPGVDAVLIGPHDLSISLGIPERYDHPRFDAAVRTIFATARDAGVAAGIHYSYGLETEITWAREAGLNFIIHNSDIGGFVQQIGGDIRRFRRELGDEGHGEAGAVDV